MYLCFMKGMKNIMSKNFHKIFGVTPELFDSHYKINPISIDKRSEVSSDLVAKRLYKDTLLQLKKEFERASDKLLEEKEYKIGIIQYGIKFNKGIEKKRNNQNKISEIEEEYDKKISELKHEYEKQTNKIKDAYNHLATKELRDISEERKGFKTERPFLNGDSAYDFFEISEQYVYSLNADEADKYLEEVYRKTVNSYQNWLSKADVDEDTRIVITKKLTLAHKYYEKICNMEARIKYKEELDTEENKSEDKIIKIYCSKEEQFEPDLIKNVVINNHDKSKALKYKESIDPVTLYLQGKRNRDIILTKTGEISFISSPNNISSYISEYEVRRMVNGKEKVDKIYANLNLQQLSRDKETGNLTDPEYYDCVVNDLLSECVLRGSKYNKGYVGGVERNQNGHYQIILKNKELDSNEKENLAAVMIYAKQQSNQKANKEQESDEGR